MNKKINISKELYSEIIDMINNVHFVDSLGKNNDFNLFFDDLWLYDTAVIENLTLVKGQWNVSLIFAYHLQPYRFLIRSIDSYSDKKKAIVYASIMRRVAAKDQRGTLTIDINYFSVSPN